MSQNVNVNLTPGGYPKEFHVSQYDVGRQLTVKVVDSTGDYSIPSGATAVLVGTKPSGFGFTLNGAINGSTVTFSTTATVTAEYGRIPCEIRITSGDTVLGTANCMLIVEMSPHPEGTTDGDGEAIVNQITLLLEQITQQADRAEAASEAAQASETAAAASEANAATSESNAAASEATALSAKNDAVAAKTAAQASEAAAEGYAVGKQNGTEVGPESPYYHNNCKWYGAQFDEALKDYAKINGYYKAMTVGTAKQLLSDSTTTDTEPYIYRQTAGDADREEVEEVVGGTVAWNQICTNGNFADGTNNWSTTKATISAENGVLSLLLTERGGFVNALRNVAIEGHKYVTLADINISNGQAQLIPAAGVSRLTTKTGSYETVGAVWASQYTGSSFSFPRVYDLRTSGWDAVKIRNVMAIDLTAMFGSTTADYIYSLEQANAGAGVAWFKELFPKSYYPYNSGELMSVKTSGHVTKDADENVIGNYPLSPIDLRGIPKWVDGKLAYDGDVYEADGTVTRKYGIVDLGSLTWSKQATSSGNYRWSAGLANVKASVNNNTAPNFICAKYKAITPNESYLAETGITSNTSNNVIFVSDATLNDNTGAQTATALSGVYLVYELATPTTETADPYTAIQACDPNGTEEWADERTVQVPVGNVTKYHANLKEKLEDLPAIPSAPSANGTYTLKATVSGGAVTYQWVNG